MFRYIYILLLCISYVITASNNGTITGNNKKNIIDNPLYIILAAIFVVPLALCCPAIFVGIFCFIPRFVYFYLKDKYPPDNGDTKTEEIDANNDDHICFDIKSTLKMIKEKYFYLKDKCRTKIDDTKKEPSRDIKI
jgi:hypothetical protein